MRGAVAGDGRRTGPAGADMRMVSIDTIDGDQPLGAFDSIHVDPKSDRT
jgi:hypothetical protein